MLIFKNSAFICEMGEIHKLSSSNSVHRRVDGRSPPESSVQSSLLIHWRVFMLGVFSVTILNKGQHYHPLWRSVLPYLNWNINITMFSHDSLKNKNRKSWDLKCWIFWTTIQSSGSTLGFNPPGFRPFIFIVPADWESLNFTLWIYFQFFCRV